MREEILRVVSLFLTNPNCETIVIDRQPGNAPFVLCFNINWNEVRDKIEAREALAGCLLAGEPIENTLGGE